MDESRGTETANSFSTPVSCGCLPHVLEGTLSSFQLLWNREGKVQLGLCKFQILDVPLNHKQSCALSQALTQYYYYPYSSEFCEI